MSLLTCSPEIIDRILSYLESIRDAAALSLSCHTLHPMCDIATRRKFHRICVYPNDQSIERAFSLLVDILKRPRLGQYVRQIEYYWRPNCEVDYAEEENKRYLRDLSESELHLLRTAVQRAGFTGPKESRATNMLMQETANDGGKVISYRGCGMR